MISEMTYIRNKAIKLKAGYQSNTRISRKYTYEIL